MTTFNTFGNPYGGGAALGDLNTAAHTFTSGGYIPQAPTVPNVSAPGSVISGGGPQTFASVTDWMNAGSPGGSPNLTQPGVAANSGQPSLTTNPFAQSAISSAQNAGAASGQQGQQNLGQSDILRSLANQGGAAAGQVLNTGFDPQNALYNRTQQQLQDQVRVGEAQRGIAMSPYGSGLENQAMSNFNIDWQNNQLGRQTQALGAFGQASNAATNTSTGGANIGQTGVGQLNAEGQLPYQASQQNQQNDINNWLAIIQAGQNNYPLQMETQSFQNAGGVPYIPQGNNTYIG